MLIERKRVPNDRRITLPQSASYLENKLVEIIMLDDGTIVISKVKEDE